jgi:membrane protein implicated in regulation of membrane protease activity
VVSTVSAWVWLLIAVAFVVIEITNLAFYALFAAMAAVAAAIASGAGGGLVTQVVVFVAVAVGGVVVLRRPLVHTFGHRRGGSIRSGVAGLVGERATVIDRVVGHESGGRVHARGEDWSAITYDDRPYEAGDLVEVVDIEKTRLVVTAT